MREIDDALDGGALSGGLEHADANTVLYRLAAHLPPPRVLSGYSPSVRALAYIERYADAIHDEICDPDRAGMKEMYQELLGGETIQSQVRSLAPALLVLIGVAPELAAPATVACLVALWLIRVGLTQWCARVEGV
jgi:hypothetical protein